MTGARGFAGVAPVLGLVLVLFGSTGCPLVHDEYPNAECTEHRDCFQSQGERCNVTTRRCEVPDAGEPKLDAAPGGDSSTPVNGATALDGTTADDAATADASAEDAS